MQESISQGTLSPTGTVLATGRGDISPLTKTLAMRFNNPAAYDLHLQKYDAATATTVTIYNLTLDAGDTVTDNLSYVLKAGDQLIASSSVAGTTYYAYSIDYAISG